MTHPYNEKRLIEALRTALAQVMRNLKEKEASSKTFIHSLVNFLPKKGENEDDIQRKCQDMIDAIVKVLWKQAKYVEDKRKFNVNEAKDNIERTALVIKSDFAGDSSELSVCKSEIFTQLKRIFNDIDESQIRNYYFCTERNCN